MTQAGAQKPPAQAAGGRRPITFLRFCERIGVTLSPAQRVLCAIAYDGLEPRDLTGEDRELARVLFGDVEVIPPLARHVIVHVCGARGGKSHILLGVRLLHLALTVPIAQLAPGENASALIVAKDMKLARQTLRFVRGAAEASPEIRQMIARTTADSLTLARGHQLVTVEILPATSGGSAVRGRSLISAALDEFAFFRDADYAVNDLAIFQAVQPRILRGGQLLIASTPWASAGMLFDFWKDNWGHPGTALVSHAPTLLLNPSKAAEVAIAREVDPENARREHDAEFLDSSATHYFSAHAVEDAADASLRLPLMPQDFPGSEVTIGADAGFRRDSSALVVVYKLANGTSVVAEILELQPKKGVPLKPSEVVRDFAQVCLRHGCTWLMGDGHYRETIEEELAKYKLAFIPCAGGADAKAATYVNARNMIHGGKLRLPKHQRLLTQLKDVVAVPLAGGGVSFTSPRKTLGGHGDILSALVLALSQRSGQRVAPGIVIPQLSREELIRKQTAQYWEDYETKFKDRKAEERELASGDMWGSWDGTNA